MNITSQSPTTSTFYVIFEVQEVVQIVIIVLIIRVWKESGSIIMSVLQNFCFARFSTYM